ncbi:hypothetical protein NC651_028465 [Populus alba x Populus x berolinensis]|nr:hypothetical protein NC651_028465 [Populus alba x Populus x berolinensis]
MRTLSPDILYWAQMGFMGRGNQHGLMKGSCTDISHVLGFNLSHALWIYKIDPVKNYKIIMLPEAAAIYCHGTRRFFEVSVIVTMNCHCFGEVCQASSSSITSLRGTHGIFRLTTHGGMSVIRQRQQSPRSTARWWSHLQSLSFSRCHLFILCDDRIIKTKGLKEDENSDQQCMLQCLNSGASMLKVACTTTHARESSHMNGSPCVIHDDSDGICHQWNKLWEKRPIRITALVADQARIS